MLLCVCKVFLFRLGRECDRYPRREVCAKYESGMCECCLCAMGL